MVLWQSGWPIVITLLLFAVLFSQAVRQLLRALLLLPSSVLGVALGSEGEALIFTAAGNHPVVLQSVVYRSSQFTLLDFRRDGGSEHSAVKGRLSGKRFRVLVTGDNVVRDQRKALFRYLVGRQRDQGSTA